MTLAACGGGTPHVDLPDPTGGSQAQNVAHGSSVQPITQRHQFFATNIAKNVKSLSPSASTSCVIDGGGNATCVPGALLSSNCYSNWYPGTPAWTDTGLPTGAYSTYYPNPANSTTCTFHIGTTVKLGTYKITQCANFPSASDCASFAINVSQATVRAAAFSQLNGDFIQNADGSASIDAATPSPIAYLSPNTGTGTAARLGANSTSVGMPTRTLVAGGKYLAAPSKLLEDNNWWEDFDATIKSKIVGGLLPPAV